jgi:proteic killer suppression protein
MPMKIVFKNTKMQKLCENHKKLQAKFNKIPSREILKRIEELRAATSLHDISKLPQADLHPLKENLAGCFSVTIRFPHRMILAPLNGDSLDLSTITGIRIEDLYHDYHRGHYA